ncbi:sulfur carrier protein ThiS [Marinomonas sp. THO17]|uniref:sulfur carrier protein ThiS n=1 Tax=Marinomonas sp. THO17 TaxID=3149048 RepID=UPI00336C27AC
MNIFINDSAYEFHGVNVQDLIEDLQKEGQGIAVAIDQTVIARSAWQSTLLMPESRVFIFESIAGG